MDKELHYTIYNSPIGQLGLVASSKGLMVLEFIEKPLEKYAELLRNKFSGSLIKFEGEFIQESLTQINEYFQNRRKDFTCSVDLRGTPFQIKVWQALQTIPYGTTCSYESIAGQIGNIRGARAVGQANGKNPVAIIIPCHRVINKSGGLGGYSSGTHIKRWLLDWEVNS